MSAGLGNALRQIESVEIVDDDQRAFRDQILDFCASHPDALYRTCLEGHLTGSAAVVDPGRRAALILHHVKLD
ncbi:MAG: hypothetical protein HKN24_02655, partial [Acidimicrobiales bacterium]|nr:hypothetical protein [Acidimicrobiales bacterium]